MNAALRATLPTAEGLPSVVGCLAALGMTGSPARVANRCRISLKQRGKTMRRLTRKIGLFGGPGALMPAMGVKKPPQTPDKPDEKSASETPSVEPVKKSWFARMFGSETDEKK
jgi:hypothetical protein